MLKKGKKLDFGKPPVWRGLFMTFPLALIEVSKVSQRGWKKYGMDFENKNWERIKNGFFRYSDALGRHILEECAFGERDKETNLFHAAQEAWNSLARLELFLKAKTKAIQNERNGKRAIKHTKKTSKKTSKKIPR